MKNIKLEELQIPDIDEVQLQGLIQQVTMQYQQQHQKMESSHWNILKQVFVLQGWKIIALQAMFTILLMLGIWMSSNINNPLVSYALMLNSGVIFAVLIGMELVRSDYFQMKELEASCAISFQRLFYGKMWILSTSSLLGILIVSFSSSLIYQLDFLPLLYGGCIPFFFLATITALFCSYEHVLRHFLILHGISSTCLIYVEYRHLSILLSFITSYGGLIVLCQLMIWLGNLWYQHRKEIML